MFFSLHGISSLRSLVKKVGFRHKAKDLVFLWCIQHTTAEAKTNCNISNYFNIGRKESYGFKFKILFYFSDTFAVRNTEKNRKFITLFYFYIDVLAACVSCHYIWPLKCAMVALSLPFPAQSRS